MKINTAIFHKSIHLDENKLHAPDYDCPFCSSRNRRAIFTLQKNPVITLLQCNSCHAVSASRMPTETAIIEYYSGYYDSFSLPNSNEQVTFDNPTRLAVHLADMFNRYQKGDNNISILDFGGGDGTIALIVAMQLIKHGARHVHITIVDYNPKTVSPGDSRITIDKVFSIEDICGKFSLVIASAVIEHYPRPRSLLENLLSKVDENGFFYARTPYMVPIMKLLHLFKIQFDFTYPGHIHDLGQSFWEGYFKNEKCDKFLVHFSRPSIVETTIQKHFIRTIIAYSLKAPWFIFCKSYKFVGGWEIFVQKIC